MIKLYFNKGSFCLPFVSFRIIAYDNVKGVRAHMNARRSVKLTNFEEIAITF